MGQWADPRKTPVSAKVKWADWQLAYRFGALVVVPPDGLGAEVNAIRGRFDPVSTAIFGAHVTITPPLAAAPTDAQLGIVARTVRGFPGSKLTFSPATTFPNTSVVYLPVEPVEPLGELRAALLRTGLFAPDDHPDFVPHLTLSEFGADPEPVLAAAIAADLAGRSFPLTHVTWIAPDLSFHFVVRRAFPLG